MTIEEKRRELFEAAYLKKYFYQADRWSLIPEKYRTQHAEIAWWAFNAALDAVVIELPEKWGEYSEEGYHFCVAIDECRAAIESTGLGLKVKP